MQKVITDDLDALLDILPPHIRQPLCEQKDLSELLEVVLDLGRPPEARFPSRELTLNQKEVDEERDEFFCGSGCKSCANTGYQGRTGLFEILQASDEIRMMLLNGTTTAQLRTQTFKEGMIPLIKDGMLKVKTDITNPAEVLRNAYSAD